MKISISVSKNAAIDTQLHRSYCFLLKLFACQIAPNQCGATLRNAAKSASVTGCRHLNFASKGVYNHYFAAHNSFHF
jgi:hypothetical protein